jgi:opacity protein-like surface antigen
MRTFAPLISSAALLPTAAMAQEPVQTLVFYALGIGIDGEATAGPLTADVDVSLSEVFENLEFAAMGSYRWDSDPWAFQVDVMYAALAADKEGSRGLARASLDLDQAMIEADVGYQLTKNLDVMVGARYWDYETEIVLQGSGPLGTVQRRDGSESWTDPLIGLRLVMPLGEHWAFTARGDVGGFGVGADFAWNVTAFFDWRVGRQFSLLAGYRIFDVEFEDEGSRGKFGLDLQQSGPGLGVAFSF